MDIARRAHDNRSRGAGIHSEHTVWARGRTGNQRERGKGPLPLAESGPEGWIPHIGLGWGKGSTDQGQYRQKHEEGTGAWALSILANYEPGLPLRGAQ